LNLAQTFNAATTFSQGGVSGVPGVTITGAPFTGGSGSTTVPQTYLNASSHGPMTFNTAGTMFGVNAPASFGGNLIDTYIGNSTPAEEFTVNSGGILTVYGGQSTVDLGVPRILGNLDQLGVSTVGSGSPQTVLASTPVAGHYRLFYYVDESAGYVTAVSAAFSISAGWTDATHARASAATSFTPTAVDTGTQLFTQNTIDFWAAASTAVTVTPTYTACGSGTWTYDLHAYVEEIR
jgi:hypothetical protein